MAYHAIVNNIVHPNQAGALPKRSATDLVAALIHDIEQALADGRLLTLLTMDVQGAFDAVLRNRLIAILRRQGWPAALIRWIYSWLTDRSATIRLQDFLTEAAKLACGLPQGSPLSPILFLLYTVALYEVLGQTRSYGYADDAAMLFSGPTLADTTTQATNAIRTLQQWGISNAVTFDPDKTEIMHFIGKRKHLLHNLPSVRHGEQEIRCDEAMRWLGVWFDPQLKFARHLKERAAIAKRTVQHLRGFCSTITGPTARAVRQAVIACVIPKLLYGAEAWLPGPTYDINPRRPPGKRLIKSVANKIQVILNHACRAIVPAWRTTRCTNLWREASIPPIQHLLYSLQKRTAARYRTLDKKHPIATRSRQTATRRSSTRLQDTLALARPIRQHGLQDPNPKPLQVHISNKTKEQAAKEFLEWYNSHDGIVVFSDGSKDEQHRVGCGAAIFDQGAEISHLYDSLTDAEVYDAEAIAALRGLRKATRLNENKSITVCLDNTAVLRTLAGRPAKSSIATFKAIRRLATNRVSFRWVPGHTGIFGNERSDELAKLGCSKDTISMPTAAHIRRVAREWLPKAVTDWWKDNASAKYSALELPISTKANPELDLPRRMLGHLLAARTGHGDFAAYHERFNHEDCAPDCLCGRRKDEKHIFYCHNIPGWLRVTDGTSEQRMKNILAKDHKRFARLAEYFFEHCCPRRPMQ